MTVSDRNKLKENEWLMSVCKVHPLNVGGTRVGEVNWWEWLNYANQIDSSLLTNMSGMSASEAILGCEWVNYADQSQ
jgi:hypothetical protein